jgi:hypothetical protein
VNATDNPKGEREMQTEPQTEIEITAIPDEAPMPVTAIELAAIRRDRERVDGLRAELGALSLGLHQREQDVIARIEAGAAVDGAAVVLHRRRQSISWLTVVAKELGHETVERIKNAWPIAFWKELQLS